MLYNIVLVIQNLNMTPIDGLAAPFSKEQDPMELHRSIVQMVGQIWQRTTLAHNGSTSDHEMVFDVHIGEKGNYSMLAYATFTRPEQPPLELAMPIFSVHRKEGEKRTDLGNFLAAPDGSVYEVDPHNTLMGTAPELKVSVVSLPDKNGDKHELFKGATQGQVLDSPPYVGADTVFPDGTTLVVTRVCQVDGQGMTELKKRLETTMSLATELVTGEAFLVAT